MSNTMDMTVGKPLGRIIRFSMPLLLGSTIEKLHALVDSVVAGRMIGLQAYAAVGVCAFPYWLVFSIVSGMSLGFLSEFSQRFGAKDEHGFNKAVSMALLLSLAIGLPLSALSATLAGPLLAVLNTPADILPQASGYLQIRFLSLTVAFVSQILVFIFYSAGNSRIPLVGSLGFVAIKLLLSVALIKATALGVMASAVATLGAQLCTIAFYAYFLKRYAIVRITREVATPNGSVMRRLLRIGLPFAFRDLPSAVTSLLIQYAINGYGSIYIAGIAAAKAMNSILFSPGDALSNGVGAYVGQNLGARKIPRIALGMRQSMAVLLAGVALLIPIMWFAGRHIISFFIAGGGADVRQTLDIGMQQLRIILLMLPFYYLTMFYRAVLQGVGNGLHSLLSGIIETLVRLAALFTLPGLLGVWGIFAIEVIGWPFMALQLAVSFRWIYARLQKQPA